MATASENNTAPAALNRVQRAPFAEENPWDEETRKRINSVALQQAIQHYCAYFFAGFTDNIMGVYAGCTFEQFYENKVRQLVLYDLTPENGIRTREDVHAHLDRQEQAQEAIFRYTADCHEILKKANQILREHVL